MKFPNLTVIDHPAVRHKLSLLRDRRTTHSLFRSLATEITQFLFYEVLRDLPLKPLRIETPLETVEAEQVDEEALPVLIPIFRAGLGMLEGALRLMPLFRVGMLGFYRDERSLKPMKYYDKLPNLKGTDVIILDPMLATGGTVVEALTFLIGKGIREAKLVSLIAAPEGVSRVFERHPALKIYTASLDRELSDKGYILPGLGDAGDRMYRT